MYRVGLAMMNDPSHVSVIVKATQSMWMSSGKISEAEAVLISLGSQLRHAITYHTSR